MIEVLKVEKVDYTREGKCEKCGYPVGFRAGMGQRHDERRGKTRTWTFITQSCRGKKFTSHPTFIWEQDI